MVTFDPFNPLTLTILVKFGKQVRSDEKKIIVQNDMILWVQILVKSRWWKNTLVAIKQEMMTMGCVVDSNLDY